MPTRPGNAPVQLRLAPSPDDGAGASPHPDGATPGPAPATREGGHVLELQIERELKDSYLTYAMSTIMDRALPDVRDGLKPSQRRILVAMNDLRLYPGKKHLKCAKICGDTSGNYHPHGDAVIYPTLVGMAQPWRMRVPLIDGQGNFGSIVPDPPAAMRYTEARLTAPAVDMLADLAMDTVDTQRTYDDRMSEPTVLPGKFPHLLVNGGVGIAVGMATSLAPNNPTEVLDSLIRLIDNPQITLAELMQDVTDASGKVVREGIKGPDFPTGGVILGRRGILEGYETGRGKVTVRGRVHTENVPDSKDRVQLVIDQIPFNVGLTTLVEQLNDAVKEDKITDIAAAFNESSAKDPVRVVIELKKGADAGVVEKQLYEFTGLQQTFSVQNIALVNRQPRTLSLKELMEHHIAHREEVIRRRTAYLLNEARRRAHVLEGLVLAVCDLDEVIRLIRSSRTRAEAIDKLMRRQFRIPSTHPAARTIPPRLMERLARAEGAGGVRLSRYQAEAIGAMRLIQLTGLELEKVVEEYRQVIAKVEEYERILADRALVLAIIRADCQEMRDRYASPRQTGIEEAEGEDLNIASLIQEHDVAVTISRKGYAKRVPLETYSAQGRGGKGIIAGKSRDDDYIEHVMVASSHDDLLVFTNTGRVFKLKVFELPEMDRTAQGRAMVNLVDLKPGEVPRAFLAIRSFEAGSHFLTFASRLGVIKRTALKAYMNVHKAGIIAVDIREGDEMLDVALTTGSDDVMLVTAQGMAIRFPEEDARDMGRAAAGVKGIELAEGDEVIGLVRVPMARDGEGDPVTADASATLLTITENGYGKRTAIDEYRVQPETGKMRSQSRGGKGRADIKTTDRNGRSVAALLVHERDDVVVVTTQGQLVRMNAATISVIGRGTQGVRVVSLNDADKVVAASRAPADSDGQA